jgi:hypothetical protein
VIPFRVTAGRQTGIYAGLDRLGIGEIREAVAVRCNSGCLRSPLWAPAGAATAEGGGTVRPGLDSEPSARDDPPPDPAMPSLRAIPCPEACPAFLGEARKRAGSGPSQG